MCKHEYLLKVPGLSFIFSDELRGIRPLFFGADINKRRWLTAWMLLMLCASGFAQIPSTGGEVITKRSLNATIDSGVDSDNMQHLNFRSVFRKDADLSGGIIADNFGQNGRVTISVHNYDRDQHDGKGRLIYSVYSDVASPNYIQKTTTVTTDVVHSIYQTFTFTTESNDIKKIAQSAKLYAPEGCKTRARLTLSQVISSFIHFLSPRITPNCLKYYEPTVPVIIEARITNATLYKFKIPGMGVFDARDFFNYQDKVKSLSNNNSIRFAIIGDEGCAGDPAANVAAMVKSWNPDFIVGMGDDNYEDVHAQFGTCGGSIDENCGQYYHDYIYPYHGSYGNGSPNNTNRFWTVLGNHDYRTIPGHSSSYLPNEWLNFFTYPNNERYYDKRIGDIHLFALNTNVRADGTAEDPDGRNATSTQALWLKARLAASNAKYKIVYGHVPPYAQANPDGSHGSDPEIQWPYQQWGASVVLSGDQHYYERNVVNRFNYVINGLGGHLVINKQQTQPIPTPGVTTEVHYNTTWGAMLAEVGTDHISCTFYDLNYHIVDQFTIPAASSNGNNNNTAARQTTEEDASNDTIEEMASPEVSVYPNPTTETIHVQLQVPQAQTVRVEIVSLEGKMMESIIYQLVEGNNELTMDQLDLSSGVVILRIAGMDFQKEERLIIK